MQNSPNNKMIGKSPKKKTTAVAIVSKEKELAVSQVQENTVESLLTLAVEKGVAIETLKGLMEMRKEVRAEMAQEAFNRAMSEFQAECPTIKKTKDVKNKDKTSRYKYAPLESIIAQIKDLLKKYGFSFTINTRMDEKFIVATCKITHGAGHSEISEFGVPIESTAFMNEAQKFASALTFAKRYAFINAFGIMTGDNDDGGTTSTDGEKDFDRAKKMIPQIQNQGMLLEIREKQIPGSSYSEEKKRELYDLVDNQLKKIGYVSPTQSS